MSATEPAGRLGDDGDVPLRVTGRPEDAHAGGQLLAVDDGEHVTAGEHVMEVARRGPVGGVGVLGVLQLVGTHGHLGVLEDVHILDVVPVGVGQHDHVDVVGRDAAFGEGVDEHHAATVVRRVDDDGLVAADEADGTETQPALVRVRGEPRQNELNFRHDFPLSLRP